VSSSGEVGDRSADGADGDERGSSPQDEEHDADADVGDRTNPHVALLHRQSLEDPAPDEVQVDATANQAPIRPRGDVETRRSPASGSVYTTRESQAASARVSTQNTGSTAASPSVSPSRTAVSGQSQLKTCPPQQINPSTSNTTPSKTSTSYIVPTFDPAGNQERISRARIRPGHPLAIGTTASGHPSENVRCSTRTLVRQFDVVGALTRCAMRRIDAATGTPTARLPTPRAAPPNTVAS